MPKRTLRTELLKRRRALAVEQWQAASMAAQAVMMQLPEFHSARCIALYAPFQNEIDTSLLVENALELQKRVLFPAVCGASMVLREVTALERLETGAFGILEPCSNGVDHDASEPDLIVVPGVGFDLRGHRVGYGKGYYDRFLHGARKEAVFIGLCHDFQVQEVPLPSERHDICMHGIVTDKRLIWCGSNRSQKHDTDFI